MADNQDLQIEKEAGKGYALSGKIMLSAIVILFAVVVFMVGLHLYARWYLIRLRRRQLARRHHQRVTRTHIVMYADRGLESAVLNSLPVFLHSGTAAPPTECAVCLSEFEEREIVRLLPKCNHSFHIECIDMWFSSHDTCPLCRSPVERVVGRGEPAGSVSEPGSSSCGACQHVGGSGADTMSLEGGRKVAELVVMVPPRRVELESELPLSSPTSRMLSFRRILSMGRRSPAGAAAGGGGGGPATRCGAGDGTSRVGNELDLESGSVGPVS